VWKAAPDAVIVMDAEGVVQGWNPAAETIFGYSAEEAIGAEVAELIVPGPLRQAHRNGLSRYLATGEPGILNQRLELPAIDRDGQEFAVELTIRALPDVAPPQFAAFLRDLRDRKRSNHDTSRLQQRMAFLAQISLVLDRSLDYDQRLRSLADLTVPELSQLTVIDLLDDDGSVHSAVAAAPNPAHARAVEGMREAHPLSLDSAHPVAAVLRSAQPVLLPDMSPTFLDEIAQGEDHLDLMHRLGYHSAIVVPLIARRRALGTLSLLRMEGAPSYNHDDLVLAEELARRAALAIDNARLFEATQHLARTLQQSLLPRALPLIPGVKLYGRYRAAAEGQEVGGDFYDAFQLADDDWGFVIGDVCGKGPEAAALTALARYTIRALSDHPPATVLRRLNEAILRDNEMIAQRFLTAIFARVRRHAGDLHVELAAGGHPPPLVLRADGSVEQVQTSGPLVGVAPDIAYVPANFALGPGDTMLLYTDGLTDAQAPAKILSVEVLLHLLRRCQGFDVERIAASLEDAATGGKAPRDDIALLVLQVEDRL
jgi:PAS domain S-box-containing protein